MAGIAHNVSMDGQDVVDDYPLVRRKSMRARKPRSVFDMHLQCEQGEAFSCAEAPEKAIRPESGPMPFVDQDLLTETLRYEAKKGTILSKPKKGKRKHRTVSTQTATTSAASGTRKNVKVQKPRVNSRGPLKHRLSK